MIGSVYLCRAISLVCVALWSATAAPTGKADDTAGDEHFEMRADLPFLARRSEPITHDVDFEVIVTPPAGTRLLRVWLPLPQDDLAQQVLASRLSTFPQTVQPRIGVEGEYGNKFAYFEFSQPHGAQIIRHQFSVKLWQLDWQVDFGQVDSPATWSPEFDPYLRLLPAEEGQVESLLQTVAPNRQRSADGLLDAMNWIDTNFTYDHRAASLNANVATAIARQAGHCSDYHGLCATMGRKLGLPARLTYGLAMIPKNSPSHCKMEVFLPPYGWVSFDLSETQKMIRAIQESSELDAAQRKSLVRAARDRLKHGFRENSWLSLTRGTDFQLDPPVDSPVRVVRTIYAEADGVPLPEPDPANPDVREFAWMTAHQYRADREFRLPFKDFSTLQPSADPAPVPCATGSADK